MKNNTENQGSHMVKSSGVMKQLNDLEKESTTQNKKTKGSTNEIEPLVTDKGLSQ